MRACVCVCIYDRECVRERRRERVIVYIYFFDRFFYYFLVYLLLSFLYYSFSIIVFFRGVFPGEGSEVFSISFSPQNILRSSFRAVLMLKNVPQGSLLSSRENLLVYFFLHSFFMFILIVIPLKVCFVIYVYLCPR